MLAEIDEHFALEVFLDVLYLFEVLNELHSFGLYVCHSFGLYFRQSVHLSRFLRLPLIVALLLHPLLPLGLLHLSGLGLSLALALLVAQLRDGDLEIDQQGGQLLRTAAIVGRGRKESGERLLEGLLQVGQAK